MLIDYHFPGNVRELRNLIERALIESGGGEIRPEHLKFQLSEATPARSASACRKAPNSVRTSVQEEENRILDFVRTHGTINNTQCRSLLNVDINRANSPCRCLTISCAARFLKGQAPDPHGLSHARFHRNPVPIARLSAESYKERKATNSQTLTGLGKSLGL